MYIKIPADIQIGIKTSSRKRGGQNAKHWKKNSLINEVWKTWKK